MTYYEIYREGETLAFDTLDEAIAFANENDCTTICEIGGSWDEYEKCWFCQEWRCDTNTQGLCEHCESYLISRGEI